MAINTGWISAADLTLTRPDGSPPPVTGADVSGSASTVIATDTVAAPDGTWDPADNGAYTVSLAAGAVKDTADNAAAGATSAFQVNAGPRDTQRPTVSISAPAVNAAGGQTETVTVTYHDDVAI